jgi:hypothetical protein
VAVSHQHLRESQALHSDYYSKKKKTASALTNRVRAHSARRAGKAPLDLRSSCLVRSTRRVGAAQRFVAQLRKCL